MTTTQKYALVMLSLQYISLNTSYTTAQLHTIYSAHQSAVDAIINDQVQLDNVLLQYQSQLSQVIIMDPNVNW